MISRSVDAQREIEMPLAKQDDDLGILSPQESAMWVEQGIEHADLTGASLMPACSPRRNSRGKK